MTQSRYFRDPPSIVLVKRLALTVVAIHAVLASISGYRAWVQVRSLDLSVEGPTMTVGSRVDAEVVSWARTFVTVRVELVQGDRTELLAQGRVRANAQAVYDPRWQRMAVHGVLSAAQLERFRPGPATVRATAVGGSQFLRTPPPKVRLIPVRIVARPEGA